MKKKIDKSAIYESIMKRVGRVVMNALNEDATENDPLWDMFINEVGDSVFLVYTDYRDSFDESGESISQCIDKNNSDELVEDWLFEAEWQGAEYYIKDAKKSIINQLESEADDDDDTDYEDVVEKWFEDNADKVCDYLYEHDKSTPIDDMIRRTTINGRIESEYAFVLDKNIEYSEAIENLCDLFQINPKDLQEFLEDYDYGVYKDFPNIPNRKPLVPLDEISSLIEDAPYDEYIKLTFVGSLPLRELYNVNFEWKGKNVVIPKGTTCLLFDQGNGGGGIYTFDIPNDLKLTLGNGFDLVCDDRRAEGHGYCTDSVYGWGKRFDDLFKFTD